MGDNLIHAYRAADGVFLQKGLKNPIKLLNCKLDPSKNQFCRSMQFSHDGFYFAYCNSNETVCIETATGKKLFSAPLGKTSRLMFSPKNTLLVTYEPWVIYGTKKMEDGTERKPDPNLRFFTLNGGKMLAEVDAKGQGDWRPQFTSDGKIFVRIENSEVRFHTVDNPGRFVRKQSIHGIAKIEVSPGLDPILACFIAPKKGQPGSIQLRNFHDELNVICRRSSFNCDNCTMQWNVKGNAMLATANVDVDKTDKSYYGTSCVYLMSKSGTDAQVILDKEGPLHSLEWSPTGNQFVASFGYMPAKTVVFNLKAAPIWTLGEEFRNEAHYNIFGSILVVCGFGNIAAGKIEIWDTDKRTSVVTIEVPNTTFFEWAPDGQHFLTATTAPRMRIENNYRIWHYTGTCEYEKQFYVDGKNMELSQANFKPAPGRHLPFTVRQLTDQDRQALLKQKQIEPIGEHPVSSMKKAGIVCEGNRYVPPHLRKANPLSVQSTGDTSSTKPSQPKKEVSEIEKKRRVLSKRIKEAIELKQRASAGEKLEKNQLDKIDRLQDLQQELESLEIKKYC